MRFKSVKYYSTACSKFGPLLAFFGGIFSASMAGATITVTPTNGGSAVSNVVYYAVTTSTVTSIQGSNYFSDTTDPDFDFPSTPINISSTIESDTDRSDVLTFNVTSDGSFTSGQSLVVAITASGSTKFAPIAMVNDSNCNDSTCQAFNSTYGHYFAAKFTPGSNLTIGIYPSSICADYVAQGVTSTGGCNSGSDVAPTTDASGTRRMALNFGIYVVSDTTSTTAPTGATQDTGGDIQLNFQVEAPFMNCPSLNNVYFPGDTEIYVDATLFSSIGTNASSTFLTGRAPATHLLVVGNDGAAATRDSSYRSTNTVVSRVPVSDGNSVVGGFTNTTPPDGTDHKHQLGFMVRDATGLVSYNGTCSLTDVQTSDIYGFLAKSDCFIASGTFRSLQAAPVQLLRAFRDRFLLSHDPGKVFVRWYYSWSPSAAEWLLKNPMFRFPVFLFLAPLEAVAWLLFHPLWLFLLAGSGMMVMAGTIAHSLRQRGEE